MTDKTILETELKKPQAQPQPQEKVREPWSNMERDEAYMENHWKELEEE